MWGALIGALLASPIAGLVAGASMGVLAGRLMDYGISDSFIDQLRDLVQPGRTVVMPLIEPTHKDLVTSERSNRSRTPSW